MSKNDITYKDFSSIIETAARIYINKGFPIRIEKIELNNNQATQYCLIVATIEILNKKGLLKEVPKFKE